MTLIAVGFSGWERVRFRRRFCCCPVAREVFDPQAALATDEPLDFLAGPAGPNAPTIRLDLAGSPAPASQRIPPPVAGDGPSRQSEARPVLSFQSNGRQAATGETFTADILASNFPENVSATAIIRFRPDIVTAERVERALDLPSRIDNELGQVVVEITPGVAGRATREIATISFNAVKAGLSYLILGNAVGAQGARGLPDNVEIRNSRIVIRSPS